MGSVDDGSVGFESVDRLVGEPDPVELAALEQTDDDFEQPLVGGEGMISIFKYSYSAIKT